MEPTLVQRNVRHAVQQLITSFRGPLTPQKLEWTVLAVMLCVDAAGNAVPIAFGTGSKSNPVRSDTVLGDCHAEVLCRRAFNVFITKDVVRATVGKGALLRRARSSDAVFELRPGLQIVMYISESPCGDCCIRNTTQVVTLADGSKQSVYWTGAPPVKAALDTKLTQSLGVLRLKPGRSDLPAAKRCMAHSCSDKILRWAADGLLSQPLWLLCQNIKLHGIFVEAEELFIPAASVMKLTGPSPSLQREVMHSYLTGLQRGILDRLLQTMQQGKAPHTCIDVKELESEEEPGCLHAEVPTPTIADSTPALWVVRPIWPFGRSRASVKERLQLEAPAAGTDGGRVGEGESETAERSPEAIPKLSPCGTCLSGVLYPIEELGGAGGVVQAEVVDPAMRLRPATDSADAAGGGDGEGRGGWGDGASVPGVSAPMSGRGGTNPGAGVGEAGPNKRKRKGGQKGGGKWHVVRAACCPSGYAMAVEAVIGGRGVLLGTGKRADAWAASSRLCRARMLYHFRWMCRQLCELLQQPNRDVAGNEHPGSDTQGDLQPDTALAEAAGPGSSQQADGPSGGSADISRLLLASWDGLKELAQSGSRLQSDTTSELMLQQHDKWTYTPWHEKVLEWPFLADWQHRSVLTAPKDGGASTV